MDKQKKIHFEKTCKGLTYNVLGVILPFLLSLIPIFILQKYTDIMSFLDEGQFFLFGAGLFTTSFFLFGENKESISKSYDKILSNCCSWFLIFCSTFYAIIYCLDLIENKITINIIFIRLSSIILFLISIISVYRSLYIDFLKIYPPVDVKGMSKEGIDDIMKNL